MSSLEIAQRARLAAQKLATMSGEARTNALSVIRKRMVAEKDAIIAANQVDKRNAEADKISSQLTKVLNTSSVTYL
jgi:glutamate-5-semialdehyde dehydrogenase